MTEEKELIVKAQAGDMGAFTELVQRHDRNVIALAARYVNNAEDAKDIFQEVMIKVYRGLPGFQFRSEFSTWIHRITVNACLTHRRRPKSLLHLPLDPGTGREEKTNVQELQSHEREPDQTAIDGDTAEFVQRALAALSPRERMVFTLRHYEGHSLKEIADALRCAEGTVKRYLFTATRKMREQLHPLL